jgi:tetrahydromethanopterin S-methyltransferase subunit G
MINKDMEKIIKRVQSESEKKMERYLGSLKEHTDDRFKAVMEGQGGLNQRLDIIQSDIDVIKNNLIQKVDRYEFEALNKRVSVVERKVMH